MCVLLNQITELTDVKDKDLISSTIRTFEFMDNREFILSISARQILVFVKWVVNNRTRISSFTIKGKFDQLPKREICL